MDSLRFHKLKSCGITDPDCIFSQWRSCFFANASKKRQKVAQKGSESEKQKINGKTNKQKAMFRQESNPKSRTLKPHIPVSAPWLPEKLYTAVGHINC